jgi:hypothetical protein
MKKELQDKIFAAFPSLYCQRNLSPDETCMCWGIECGDGWFELIYNLSKDISNISKDIYATQVKEKFGSLRFYWGGDGLTKDQINTIEELIDNAEDLSYSTCEECGSTVDVKQTEGWIMTLCKKCMKEYMKRKGID